MNVGRGSLTTSPPRSKATGDLTRVKEEFLSILAGKVKPKSYRDVSEMLTVLVGVTPQNISANGCARTRQMAQRRGAT